MPRLYSKTASAKRNTMTRQSISRRSVRKLTSSTQRLSNFMEDISGGPRSGSFNPSLIRFGNIESDHCISHALVKVE